MDRYSLTPFDDRYLNLPFEWMDFQYNRYMNNFGYSALRDYTVKKKLKDRKEQKEKAELMENLNQFGDGFSPADMEQIMKEFSEASK